MAQKSDPLVLQNHALQTLQCAWCLERWQLNRAAWNDADRKLDLIIKFLELHDTCAWRAQQRALKILFFCTPYRGNARAGHHPSSKVPTQATAVVPPKA